MIEVGQQYLYNDRLLTIVGITDHSVEYRDDYGDGDGVLGIKRVTSRIVWELDIQEGELVLVGSI